MDVAIVGNKAKGMYTLYSNYNREKSEVDVAIVGKKAKWLLLKSGKSEVDVAKIGKKAKWMWLKGGGGIADKF